MYQVNSQVVDAVNAGLPCFSEPDLNMLLRAPTTLGKLPPDAPSNPPDDGKGKPQQPSQALGVAVVSYGYWGLNLVRNFADLESAGVVSVSDLDPEKLTLVRRRHAGVEVTTEFRELPEDPRVDAVAIVTAVTHYQVALAALKPASMCWPTSRSSGFLCNRVTWIERCSLTTVPARDGRQQQICCGKAAGGRNRHGSAGGR